MNNDLMRIALDRLMSQPKKGIDSTSFRLGYLAALKDVDDTMTVIPEVSLNTFVLQKLSDESGYPIGAIVSKTRKREIVQVRQLLHYLSYIFTHQSLEYIGNLTSHDHATVSHSIKTIIEVCETNRSQNQHRKSFMNMLGEHGYFLNALRKDKYEFKTALA